MSSENTPQNAHDGQLIIPRLIQEELKQSYLDYSMSVIVGRALPDIRDGLKPVHRRVLFSMHEMGLTHNKPFKKSARVVGDCLGKYHPHGDTAVYDALVRMAQDFSLRYPLISGQGNFGSVDGDPPAAMRYTECRLTKLAQEMLEDLDKETVAFTPNFDNSSQEPSVMPSKVPNLLLNGSSGIAVGMATNIPPHNMGEICDAIMLQLDNPEISVGELMQIVTGPDFPTGGIICGDAGIKEAYHRGHGKIIVRAKTSVEEKGNRKNLIVSEIPYMVNKSELIEEIAGLSRDKRIEGIFDLRDESDKRGMRIVIELKKDADPSLIENQLFSHSRLQVTFGVNMLSLVGNVPKILSLKDMIHYYIEHRKDVITRRTQYDLKKAQERAHILEGLLIALKNIDEVISLIKASASADTAKTELMATYTLSEQQALAILDMRLQRLTSLEQEKLRNEHVELLKQIAEFIAILSDLQKIIDIIKTEIQYLKAAYADARRTLINYDANSIVEDENLIKREDVVVTITHSGYIKRIPLDTYKVQNRGGKGIIATQIHEEDLVKDVFVANTHSHLLFFTNKGKVHWLKVYHIPEASRQGKGKAIVNLLTLDTDEKVRACIPVTEFIDTFHVLMVTKKGLIKKTNLMAFSNPRKVGIIAMTLIAGDDLVSVELADDKKQVIIATKNGMASRFSVEDVRASGRSSQGVRGITLRDNGEVIGMVAISSGQNLLTVTENGYGKQTPAQDYRLINRGGVGVINIKTTERNGGVVAICAIKPDDEVMFISKNGIVIRVRAADISNIGRNTQGVRLMRLADGDNVVNATVAKE